MKRLISWAVIVTAWAAITPADAECRLDKFADLPVTMVGPHPILEGRINGHATRFMVDSGAFWSMLSAASASEYGLKPAPPSFQIRAGGIGGSSNVEAVKIDELLLGGALYRSVEFLVGGSDLSGGAGVIGQNILYEADVDYDLAHGHVGLFRRMDCKGEATVPWPAGQTPSAIGLEDDFGPYHHTLGTILINGKRIRAAFDTGAATSLLSKSVAGRLGIRLDGPGVEQGPLSRGFGGRVTPSWIVPVETIRIGAEEVRGARLRVGELDAVEMLIGADFFLTHRVFVSNSQRKIYIAPLGDSAANPSVPPIDAEGYSRRGLALAAGGQLDQALADLDKAVALAPGDPRYLVRRAELHGRRGQGAPMLADLDHALAIDPNYIDALVERAQVRMILGNRAGAIADVTIASNAIDKANGAKLLTAALFSELDDQPAAIADYTLWIDSHPDDSSQPAARNGRCRARALADVDLPKALVDCTAALRAPQHRQQALESRGFVRLRMGDYAAAVADYDAALAIDPRLAWSLYGRGLAKLKLGDRAGGEADIAAARGMAPKLMERAARYGLVP